MKIANLLIQHNVPIAITDHLSPILKDIFSDSDVACNYAAARTKTSCIINGALAPYIKSKLIDCMKSQPFAIAIDGSNDTGLEKMNPITVRLFDSSCNTVVTRFLDMCITKGMI